MDHLCAEDRLISLKAPLFSKNLNKTGRLLGRRRVCPPGSLLPAQFLPTHQLVQVCTEPISQPYDRSDLRIFDSVPLELDNGVIRDAGLLRQSLLRPPFLPPKSHQILYVHNFSLDQ